LSIKALPIQIEEQIERSTVRTKLNLERLAERVQLSFLNSSTALQRLNLQDMKFLDFQLSQEYLQDSINDNMLKNSGFELDEEIAEIPDDWTRINELGYLGDCYLDDSKCKYGYRSLKLEGMNLSDVSRGVYVKQDVEGVIIPGAYYTLSYYYADDDFFIEEFNYYIKIEIRDEEGEIIDIVDAAPEQKAIEVIGYNPYLKDSFLRHHKTFMMPEGAHKATVCLGIMVKPHVEELVSAWIDYPIFHMGIHIPKPSELIDGIIRTQHISVGGLDAKVIKTGIITISEQLSLETEGGDIRLRYDEETQGNVLEFISDEIPIITLGKFGINPEESGLIIRNSDGYEALRVDRAGNLSLGIGDIGPQILLDGGNSRVIINDEQGNLQVVMGQYDVGLFGICAGDTILNADGIEIGSGTIRLGDDGQGNPLFYVSNQGYLRAQSGTIAGFSIIDDTLQSNTGSLVLDGTASSITLASSPDYQTHILPEGIFGTVPLARVSSDNFDPEKRGPSYYLEIKKVMFADTEYKNGSDYSYNKISGEIIKRKASLMPDIVDVEYTVVEYDESTGTLTETDYTETLEFVPTTRVSALISDDSLLDLSFVKNLVIGTAEIGVASINTAHIREIHGSKIVAHSIDTNQLTIGKGGNLIPNSTFASREFYKDWLDLMLGAPVVQDNVVTNGYEYDDTQGLYDGRCIKLATDSGDKYFGLDIQIGTVLKPNTWYVFSAFHKLEVPDGASLIGFYLDVGRHCSNVGPTDLPFSDNEKDVETHGWKRKAVRFKTDSSGYVRLTSVLEGVSGEEVVGWIDGFMLEEGYNESDFVKSGTTRIHGSHIQTGSITLSQLAFTPVDETTIIATINASEEGLRISGNKITIDGSVQFASSQFDPREKLDKSIYLTPGTTTIDGGMITARSIRADALEVGLATELINNFTKSGNLDAWTTEGSLVKEITKDGHTVQTLKVTTTSNSEAITEFVEIEPNVTYEVKVSIYSNQETDVGTRYFGVYVYNENKQLISVTPFDVENRTWGTATNEAYFWSGDVYGGQWRDMTAYVLGCNTIEDEVLPGRNVTRHFKLRPDARYIRIRLVNGDNEGTSVTNHFYSPNVIKRGSTVIAGDNIKTGTILVSNNLIVKAAGSQGFVDITPQGIWARNIEGEPQAGFDITGKFMAGRITIDGEGLMARDENENTTVYVSAITGSAAFRGRVEAGTLVLPVGTNKWAT
jgi:hypothetical protein